MDDLAQRIGSILQDEESMKQIGELAAMLGLAPDASRDNSQPSFSSNPAGGFGSSNRQGSQNTQGLGLSNNQNAPFQNLFGGMDMGAIMSLASKLKDFNADDNNTRFLLALRPLLGEEKQNKIDRAVKILKLLNLMPLIKDSGLLGGDFLGIL